MQAWLTGFKRWQLGLFIGRRHFGIGWARAEPWLHGFPIAVSRHGYVFGHVAILNVPGGRYRVGAFVLDCEEP